MGKQVHVRTFLKLGLLNTFKENHPKSTQFMGIMPMMSFHSFLVFQKDLLKLHYIYLGTVQFHMYMTT